MLTKRIQFGIGCGLLLLQAILACGLSGWVLCHAADGRVIIEMSCLPCGGGAAMPLGSNDFDGLPNEGQPENCSDIPLVTNQAPPRAGDEVGDLRLASLLALPASWASLAWGGEPIRVQSTWPRSTTLPKLSLSALRTTILVV